MGWDIYLESKLAHHRLSRLKHPSVHMYVTRPFKFIYLHFSEANPSNNNLTGCKCDNLMHKVQCIIASLYLHFSIYKRRIFHTRKHLGPVDVCHIPHQCGDSPLVSNVLNKRHRGIHLWYVENGNFRVHPSCCVIFPFTSDGHWDLG